MEFVTALRSGLDDQKPSLFELLSEQQLSSLLPPTIRYLLVVATQRYPRYLLRILNSYDELYALLMLIVERHYLRTRGGSFTENFYGLKREKALQGEIPRAAAAAPTVLRDVLKLSSVDVWKNLAVLVGVPYLKRKLDEAYEINAPRALMGAAYNQLPPNPKIKDRLLHGYRWFLKNIYPSVNAAYTFAVLAFNLAYLFDNSRYHHPLMWLIGTRMRRMNIADMRAIEQLSKVVPKGGPPGARSIFDPRYMAPRLLSSLSVLLPTSIFALKFLEWWYASDFAKQLSRRAAENLDLPPPVVSSAADAAAHSAVEGAHNTKEPKSSDEEEDRPSTIADIAPIAVRSLLPIYTVAAPSESEQCPICGEEITNPTACQTGIIYCYVCIHKWITGTHPKQESFISDKIGKWESGIGRCAVTGRRVLGGTEGLRRIMV
jgi:peroxin-12